MWFTVIFLLLAYVVLPLTVTAIVGAVVYLVVQFALGAYRFSCRLIAYVRQEHEALAAAGWIFLAVVKGVLLGICRKKIGSLRISSRFSPRVVHRE